MEHNLLKYDYYPYGETRINENTGHHSIDHQFTGYEKDTSTKLSYAGARYLDNGIGRFMSQDQANLRLGINKQKELEKMLTNPQLLNTYSYAGNNPVVNRDDNGELSIEVFKSHPLSSIVHVYGWTAFSLAFKVWNKPLAGKLLSHSASLNPGDINIDSPNQSKYGNVIDKIIKTKPYNDFINEQINKFENGEVLKKGSLAFEKYDDPDLYYSLHLVDISTNIHEAQDGLIIESIISDLYDFKNPKGHTEKGLITQSPVRQAYKDMKNGYLGKYRTFIKIKQKKKYEKKN